MSDFAVSFSLKLNDQGSAPAARALQTLQRAMKDTESVARSTSSNAINAFQKLSTAREVLGIRSEKAIQNEIRQTEAAYKRMAESGQASARELARAQDAARQRVAELRREMNGVRESAFSAGKAMTAAVQVMAGYHAGKAVLAGPVAQTMSYDRQLANLANTAYAGQSLDARKAGMGTLNEAVMSAVRTGGGTREGAMGTLDKLLASGAYENVAEVTKILPDITKAATASRSDPLELAQIAIAAKQNFGLSDVKKTLDMAMAAGKMGGFELKDMAHWLPRQMAMASLSGLNGEEGFRVLLAANQSVVTTAGSTNDAGNNLVNLLQKINSNDTAKDAKKLGIDLSGSLAAARAKGTNSLDAFMNLSDQIIGKDKRYQELLAKLPTAKGPAEKETIESMLKILKGSAIGDLLQDRETILGFIGVTKTRALMNQRVGSLAHMNGTIDADHALIASTASYKEEQLAAEKANAMQRALDNVNPLLGKMAEHTTGLIRDFPLLSAAAVGATTALTALAAAAGAGALGGILMRGGAGAAGGAAAGGILSRMGGLAGRAGAGLLGLLGSPAAWALGSAAAVGYGTGTVINSGINAVDNKFGTGIGNDIGRWMAFLMAGLGNQEAKRALQIEIDVKNGNIVAAVKEQATREARRN